MFPERSASRTPQALWRSLGHTEEDDVKRLVLESINYSRTVLNSQAKRTGTIGLGFAAPN